MNLSGALWFAWVILSARSDSPCAECDAPETDPDLTEFLQVRSNQTKEDASLSTDGPDHPKRLTFRVIPVNFIRPSFFKRRAKKNAVTMGGGGTRAMAGTTGQVRALLSMGLLDEVDEVISLSGSSWSMSIFAYGKGFTKEELLGSATFGSLDQLTLVNLQVPNGKILSKTVLPISVSVVTFAALGSPANRVFDFAIAATFFCEFGINGFVPVTQTCFNNNENQIWTTSEERLAWINKTNPHLKLDNALVANGNLKSLLLTSTLLAPVGYNPSNDSIVSIRLSGDFSGTPYYADCRTVDYEPWNSSLPPLDDVVVGGGIMETFAFLATNPPESSVFPRRGRRGSWRDPSYHQRNDRGLVKAEVVDDGILPLQEAVGLSSAILAMLGVSSPDFLKQFFIDPIQQASGRNLTAEFAEDPYLFAPRRTYWPVVAGRFQPKGDIKAKEFYIGDGASIDSTGMLEGIRGGAECVVVLINNGWPIESKGTVNFCDAATQAAILANPLLLLATTSGLGPQQSVYDYFGVAVPNLILKAGLDYANNQVFETSEIISLYCEAQTLREQGEAVVVYRNYTTLENKYWGIKAGKEVGVVFAWNEKTQKWLDELPNETQTAINNGDFDSLGGQPGFFPFLGTFFPSGADYTQLKPEQANLYASLQEWSLRQSQAKLESCMGL